MNIKLKIVMLNILTLFILNNCINTVDEESILSPPSPPININVTPTDAKIMVSWISVPNATSYNLYYGTSSGNYTNSVKNVTSIHLQNGLTNGTKYYLAMKSVGKGGESIYSAEKTIIVGLVDNEDGTITDYSTNLTWSKCNQIDQSGNNAYNTLYGDCRNGTPAKLQRCDTISMCSDSPYGILINLASMTTNGTYSQIFNSCYYSNVGGVPNGTWRLPKTNELESLHIAYTKMPDYWPNLANGYYWGGSGWGSPENVKYGGGQVAYSIVDGVGITPAIAPAFNSYVICVR